MDNTQVKTLEEKLKSQLSLLELEHAVFERIVYKNKNQHRRCSYFQYLEKVRRELRVFRRVKMEEIMKSCFHVLSDKGSKQKLHALENLKLRKCNTGKPNILERLLGGLRLLSQMVEPILKAASGISVLLARSFFVGFSVTSLAMLARLRVLLQQILLDAVSVFNLVTSTSLKKQSVKIAQDGVEVFREFYPKDVECFTLLDCVWKTDKYVLSEILHNRERSKPVEENVLEDATTKDSLIQYRKFVSFLGEDLSPLVEADNGDVTARISKTPIAEVVSLKNQIAIEPEVSENLYNVTARDCLVQYQTSVSPLEDDLSSLLEADNRVVTESSTPIAEAAPSDTNNALKAEVSINPDATTRNCSIQYQTSLSSLGEDISPSPLLEEKKKSGVSVAQCATSLAEATASETNNESQIEDSERLKEESTTPMSPAKIVADMRKPSFRATKVAFLPMKRPSCAMMPNTMEEPARKKLETGEEDKKEEENDAFYNLLIGGTQKDSLF